ncbi:MAG TPA: hypothetical protein VNI02_07445 [Blastocatellia bacterium]|jgi:hypothetical protein|nr:hypothetical protein [Blastocatellia bacterium]
MERSQNREELFRRYLLGLLEQEEEYQFEERLLSDTEYFEELLMAEDELVDDYIDGTLSEREREKFEHYFLATPERQQKLNFARALKRHVTVAELTRSPHAAEKDSRLIFWKRFIPARPGAKRPMLAFSFAVLLIVILGGSWLIVKNLRPQNRAGANAIVVNLSPGLLRGAGEIRRVDITPDVSTVRLHLELVRDDYQSYRAVVQTGEGDEVYVADKLTPETLAAVRAVTFDLPAELLVSGDFQVKLSGTSAGGGPENVGKYYFRVAPPAAGPRQP